jgi:glycosyltransferase involved in cell wall biosynthesis
MRSFARATVVVTVSDFTARSLRDTTNLTNIEVLPNFIDTDCYRPAEAQRQAPGRPFRLLFVGNPTRRKGGDLLAPIMQQLGPDFELCITGGLRGVRPRTTLANMHFLGKLTEEELIRSYQTSDALLFPTRFEGFGYAAAEAMACGCPVIATNTASLPEIVRHGQSGLLCRVDDVSDFVAACRTLATDHARWRAFCTNARTQIVANFSEKAIAARYIELYQRIVKRPF